jgi:DNA-binding NarL/FixJ family response regulator
MAEFMIVPLVREVCGVREVEVAHTMEELLSIDTEQLVNVLVFSVMAIGFNMDNQLNRIKLQFPEAFMVCISPHPLSDYISMRLIKNGVDVILANISCKVEFQRATAAIQFRRRYYPPDLRRLLDERVNVDGKGYRFLSRKEHAMLVMTLKGYTLKEIASKLAVAETTACTTRKNAFRKMGVRSLVELVKIGFQYNLHHYEEKDYAVEV